MAAKSKYHPKFCKELITHLQSGLSFESFAGNIRIHPDTINNWAKKHPEFAEAKAIGHEISRMHWEKIGLAGIAGRKNFNAAVYIFTMKNRFAWKDATESNSSLKLTVNTKEEKAAKILDFLGVVQEKE